MRRAIRHGYKLGARAAFFHKLVPDLVAADGRWPIPNSAKPGAAHHRGAEAGRRRFFETSSTAWTSWMAELTLGEGRCLHGETAFKLHDTYGFPLDLTQDICREHGVTVDDAGFDAAMATPEGTGPRRRQVQDGRQPGIRRPGHHLPRLRATWSSRPRCSPCTRTALRSIELHEGEHGRGRARQHPVLRRVRRPGRRPRRAAAVIGTLRRRGHAEDPGHRVRPPRRGQDRHADGRQQRHRQGGRAEPASAPCATTRPPT